nr:hypothetical protein [Tanacetum cinerariifolium]
MGRQTGRGCGRTGEPTSRVGGRMSVQDSQGGDRGIRENGGVDEVPDFSTVIAQVGYHASNIQGNVSPSFGSPENQRVERYIYGLALQIHVMVAAMELTTIQSVVLKAGLLTDEAIRNGSLKKKTKKRENGGELSRNENVMDHNKRSRTIRVFAKITNPVRKEYTGTTPKCTNCSFYHNHEMPCCKCTNCNHLRNFASDCRVGPRMVTLVNAKNLKTTRGECFMYGGTDHYKAAFPRLNRAPRPGGNCQNQPMAIGGGQGRGNNDPSKIEDAKNWEALRRPSEILKDKLCNTPVLALPDGPEDFVVYCNASGLGIGKVNIVANALSRKERIKPTKVRVMNITIHSSIKDRILATQKEVSEVVNTPAEMLRGLDKQMERSSDGAWYYLDRIRVPLKGDVRTLIMDEAYKSKHSVHPRTDKCTMTLGIDRLTKLAHFLPIREDYKVDMLARLYLSDIIARHGVPISIISDHDSRLHQGFDSQCKRHYKLGVVRFGKKGKLAPRFVRPFEITKRIGPVAYRLRLPQDLNDVHDTFHVSNLKKCFANQIQHVPLKEIQVDAKLNFVEEPVKIFIREFKKLNQSRIPIIKVRWNLKQGPEFT